jgi:uncharacterized protein (DUF302 family)
MIMETKGRKHKTLTEQDFKKVLVAVEKGSTYKEAVKTIKWGAFTFKKRITDEQRLELRKCFVSNIAKRNKERGLKVFSEEDFKKVLVAVEKGSTYKEALKTIKCSAPTFKKRITEEQRLELRKYFASNLSKRNKGRGMRVFTEEDFKKVLRLVQSGVSIAKAVKHIGWSEQGFRNRITEKQKVELQKVKRTTSKKIKIEKFSHSDFAKVLSLIEQNLSITDAVKVIGWDRGSFYKAISEKQKLELRMVSTANTLYGMGSHFKKDFTK